MSMLFGCLNGEGAPKASSGLIYPGAVLTENSPSTGYALVAYESFAGRDAVSSYYQSNLERSGWRKTAELGPEDATECGGDWGGVYEKGGSKFKLHVCGFGNPGTSTDIYFYFYGMDPQTILGGDLSGGRFTCATDAIDIHIVDVCSTDDTFKAVMETNRPDLFRSFNLDLGGHAYFDVQATDAGGMKTITLASNGSEFSGLTEAAVTPIPVVDGTAFGCDVKRMVAKVRPC